MKIIKTKNYSKVKKQAEFTTMEIGYEGEKIRVPATWEICDNCRGSGASSDYMGEISDEARHEMMMENTPGGNEFEEYMGGAYDKKCESCDGTGKVLEVYYEKLSPEQREYYDEYSEGQAELAAEDDMRRRGIEF